MQRTVATLPDSVAELCLIRLGFQVRRLSALPFAVTDRSGPCDDVHSVGACERTGPAAHHVVAASVAPMTQQSGRKFCQLVGGASMFANLIPAGSINIGDRNLTAARRALAERGVPIIAEDVGSDHGRSVHFHLEDGRVEVHSLKKGNRVI